MNPPPPASESVADATRSYEEWLGERVEVVGADLVEKHELMKVGTFAFLRATFYRWIQLWANVCADEADAPVTASIGDIHIENYGTWRDGEGRLAWGVNDFDEACPLAYTHDLVRLATSALLARREGHLPGASRRDVCSAILDGYEAALRSGPKPIVLAEGSGWLGDLANQSLKNPDRFWKKLKASESGAAPSGSAERELLAALPPNCSDVVCFSRTAGVGSRGRPRFAAVATWNGARVAREIKSLAPSAWEWANAGPSPTAQSEICSASARSPDPSYGFRPLWVVRRLAPDCSKIELVELPGPHERLKMLKAMSRELLNVHSGTAGGLEAIRLDWNRRGQRRSGWLEHSALAMAERVERDFEEWRR